MAELTSSDGLLRWLVGGLVMGAIVLGLLVGVYEIGYHRGKGKVNAAGPSRTASTTPPPPRSSSAVARGERLFSADGCGSCHSLTGASMVGPTVKGLAGSQIELSDGRSVTADDAYLAKAITDPDAELVKGYQKGVMSASISSFGLAERPQDVEALVAFIKAQR
ncbi:MAG TPA: cytochrome c [Gaiellaceae bacterium]|nr:cytochrome c [Gaiellaceae bacterium]